MNDKQRRQELADFLRTRRMRLSPEQVGLNNGGRRRTPGLRREEVALRANVGVAWYTLLEQGRAIHPSREVLQNIADALLLTSAERQYLFSLADQSPHIDTHISDEQVSPALRRVLDGLHPFPAYIVGRRWDYLAWNMAAEQVFLLFRSVPPYEHNVVWHLFVDPMRQQIYKNPSWEQVAQKVLAEFRTNSVHYADEEWFGGLIADLQRVSPEFRAWWPRHDVRGISEMRKEIVHPLVGDLVFEHTTLQVPAMPELKLMVYTPLSEMGTQEKLQRLLDQSVMNAV
ncbi:helix-turn-helix protein [Thermosporothrix hazakensis]|jgi:transcriptional regulator with XRE-family HTH domain|uniref:Helix-turn-helix protein n=1 Tax=Thermosporothrix hazakensis TaxID=644383 RepID=A0A326TSA4_THEHA|nr:helix-turn-helix transcriptional regulator [Thermosporothrix hazakensis]PZW18059.1 helix-turn-helix protein [Thermosporothrix hazakensis]GCE46244.1 transcriptional regulator [Thermosporothrix hazakensis]